MDSTSLVTTSWKNIIEVMNTLGGSAGQVMPAIMAFAYVAGIFFLGMGIVAMTKAANSNARTSVTGTGWFWSMLVGVILFALPETMSVVGSTFFPDSNTSAMGYMSYLRGENLSQGSCKLGGLRPLFVVFGFIAAIRALIIFRTVGMYGSHTRGTATTSRGFVLLVAGIALVHMQDFLSGINKVTGLNLGAGLC